MAIFYDRWYSAVPKPMTHDEKKSKNMIGFEAGPRPQIDVVTHAPVEELKKFRTEILKEKE